jgi:hypothetical protein
VLRWRVGFAFNRQPAFTSAVASLIEIRATSHVRMSLPNSLSQIAANGQERCSDRPNPGNHMEVSRLTGVHY